VFSENKDGFEGFGTYFRREGEIMAFIRERVIKGKAGIAKYYQILETYQQNGRKKQRVICGLGKWPSLEEARAEAERRGNKDVLTLQGEKNVKGKGNVKESVKGNGSVKESKRSVKRNVKKAVGESVKESAPKRKPGLKIRAIDADELNLTTGPNVTGAVFSERPLEPVRPSKRRFRPRPVPPEAQGIISEIGQLLAVKAGDDVLIEKVRRLCEISTQATRHWLKWINPERLDHLLREARKKIPRVRRGFGRAEYDVLPPPPPGEAWGKAYWTRFTLELISAKVKGDAKEIAKRIFPHCWKTQRIGLAQASLTHSLLKDRPDQSLDPSEFHQLYQAADYKAVVASIKRHGEQDGQSKLTREQVNEIRRRYAGGGVTYRALGEEFGTSRENIYKVIKGKTWKSAGNR